MRVHLTHTIAHRVALYLERQGVLERDAGNSYLTAEGVDADPDSPMNQLLGSSITYRIALGPQQGRKVFTLQTLPDCRPDSPFAHTVGKVAGFSLHAGVATRSHDRDQLERLCRYITRPAVSTKRLSLTRHGKVRYELKTPYSDGTTHIIFEPLDFIARLAALVPRPRVNLTRYHGVFAPNSKHRMQVPNIHQRPLWVDSGISPSHHAKGRLTPYSCHSKDTKFNDANNGNRPRAAIRRARTPPTLGGVGLVPLLASGPFCPYPALPTSPALDTCWLYTLAMNRRDLIQSTGKWLLALAGLDFRHTTAGMKSVAVTPPGAENSVTLFLCGDVMTGRGIDQVLPHPGDPLIHEYYMKSALGYVDIAEEVNGPIPKPVGFSYIWGDALGELDGMAPDLRIINLETSVTTSDDFWPRKGIHYRMHPDNTPAISAAGIDCCVLANNHVLDWGYSGLAETLATLRKAGLQTPGAGRNLEQARAPAIFDLGEKGRVILFALASETSGVPSAWAATHDKAGVNFITDFLPASVNRIADQVRALKQPDDIVVLSIHWGSNWGYEVPFDQREFAHQLIDKAAIDVIHGHSSHHPRGIEVYRNKPIIYGCGDFVNDYEGIRGHGEYRGDLSLMYFVSVNTRSGELTRLEMTPMRIRRFQLNRASGEEASWLAATMDRESRRFKSRVELQEDQSLSLGWGNAALQK